MEFGHVRLFRYRRVHISLVSTFSVVGRLVPLSCPSGGTVVDAHVSSHVFLQQESFAPGEFWLSCWQSDKQQETEIVQGPEQSEQNHRTGSVPGFAIVTEEPVHAYFSVSVLFHSTWFPLTLVAHSTLPSSRYQSGPHSVSSQPTKTCSASRPTLHKLVENNSLSLRTNALSFPTRSRKSTLR